MNRKERALGLFKEGFSCSQAVAAAFAEDQGLPVETALRLSQGFGGGMARLAETCGAVTGAIMIIGLKHGRIRAKDDEAKERTYALVQELVPALPRPARVPAVPGPSRLRHRDGRGAEDRRRREAARYPLSPAHRLGRRDPGRHPLEPAAFPASRRSCMIGARDKDAATTHDQNARRIAVLHPDVRLSDERERLRAHRRAPRRSRGGPGGIPRGQRYRHRQHLRRAREIRGQGRFLPRPPHGPAKEARRPSSRSPDARPRSAGAELLRAKPRIDIVVGPDRYHELPALLAERTRGGRVATGRSRAWHEFGPDETLREDPSSAYVPIMEGCDNFCAYCVVPFARGREKCRPMERRPGRGRGRRRERIQGGPAPRAERELVPRPGDGRGLRARSSTGSAASRASPGSGSSPLTPRTSPRRSPGSWPTGRRSAARSTFPSNRDRPRSSNG